MESLKTAAIVVLLLAVLYGVYNILNQQPATPPPEIATMTEPPTLQLEELGVDAFGESDFSLEGSSDLSLEPMDSGPAPRWRRRIAGRRPPGIRSRAGRPGAARGAPPNLEPKRWDRRRCKCRRQAMPSCRPHRSQWAPPIWRRPAPRSKTPRRRRAIRRSRQSDNSRLPTSPSVNDLRWRPCPTTRFQTTRFQTTRFQITRFQITRFQTTHSPPTHWCRATQRSTAACASGRRAQSASAPSTGHGAAFRTSAADRVGADREQAVPRRAVCIVDVLSRAP